MPHPHLLCERRERLPLIRRRNNAPLTLTMTHKRNTLINNNIIDMATRKSLTAYITASCSLVLSVCRVRGSCVVCSRCIKMTNMSATYTSASERHELLNCLHQL